MDDFARAKTLRENYESALDAADSARQAYHREVIKLYRAGMSLREIADGLGLSHQRVHQIVGVKESRRRVGRTSTIAGAIALVVGLAAGGIVLAIASGSATDHAQVPRRSTASHPEDRSQLPLCDLERQLASYLDVSTDASESQSTFGSVTETAMLSGIGRGSVVTTIGSEVQSLAERIVLGGAPCVMTESGPKHVVILDSRTGEVIGLFGSAAHPKP